MASCANFLRREKTKIHNELIFKFGKDYERVGVTNVISFQTNSIDMTNIHHESDIVIESLKFPRVVAFNILFQ